MFKRSLLALLLTAAVALPAAAGGDFTATILCYHVVESPADTHFTLSRATFDRQMAYLAAAGYRVIPLSMLGDYVNGRRDSLPRNAVVITIDDGWRSTYTEFFSITRKYGFPFTAFIYPKFIGQGKYALTWEMVREMADQGVEIESHAYSHPFLARSKSRFSSAHYAQWLASELIESKRIIEEQIGRPVRYLAYPYGDFDQTVVTQTRAAGYDGAVTVTFGSVRRGDDAYRLNRVVIERGTSFAEFRRMLGAAPLPLEDMHPRPGSEVDHTTPVIEATIANPEKLLPSSVSVAVLGQGRVPFSYDPTTGRLSTVLRPKQENRWHDVVVWGTERGTGRRLEAMWRIRFPDVPLEAEATLAKALDAESPMENP